MNECLQMGYNTNVEWMNEFLQMGYKHKCRMNVEWMNECLQMGYNRNVEWMNEWMFANRLYNTRIRLFVWILKTSWVDLTYLCGIQLHLGRMMPVTIPSSPLLQNIIWLWHNVVIIFLIHFTKKNKITFDPWVNFWSKSVINP
jgi:hypothetical protein